LSFFIYSLIFWDLFLLRFLRLPFANSVYYTQATYTHASGSGGSQHITNVDHPLCHKEFPCVSTAAADLGYCGLPEPPFILPNGRTTCLPSNDSNLYCYMCCEHQSRNVTVVNITTENKSEE
jgi:hypothetical protein